MACWTALRNVVSSNGLARKSAAPLSSSHGHRNVTVAHDEMTGVSWPAAVSTSCRSSPFWPASHVEHEQKHDRSAAVQELARRRVCLNPVAAAQIYHWLHPAHLSPTLSLSLLSLCHHASRRSSVGRSESAPRAELSAQMTPRRLDDGTLRHRESMPIPAGFVR